MSESFRKKVEQVAHPLISHTHIFSGSSLLKKHCCAVKRLQHDFKQLGAVQTSKEAGQCKVEVSRVQLASPHLTPGLA